MKISTFWLPQILAMVCLMTITVAPAVFADAHEAGEHGEHSDASESSTSGWFRTDTDSLGTQIWFGASHSPAALGNISIDTDIYIVGTFAEFDFGLGIPVVESDSLELRFLPMVGIGFDYASANAPSSLIAPQLFTYLTAGSIYFESWVQGFFNSPFDYGDDSLYTRDFILYSLNDTVAIGPQAEVTLGLGDEGELSSFVVGARANIGYGENNTLALFVGYETKKEDEDTGITGRMTFVRNW